MQLESEVVEMNRDPYTGRFGSSEPRFGGTHRQHKYRRVGKCVICGEQFAASRRDKRYCSDRCRQRAVVERKLARNDLADLTPRGEQFVKLLDRTVPRAAEYIRRVKGSYGPAEALRAIVAISDAMKVAQQARAK